MSDGVSVKTFVCEGIWWVIFMGGVVNGCHFCGGGKEEAHLEKKDFACSYPPYDLLIITHH